MHGNRASSLGEGVVSWGFSSFFGNQGYILELRRGWSFKTLVCSATSGLLSSCEGQLWILLNAWQGNRDASRGEAGVQSPFPVATGILGFLSIFKRRQASSPFEALNSVCPSRCQRDVIPPVQMRRRPTTFSRVSTGDSDIPSSCDMKQEPKFKPLQGNPAFL